MKSILSYVLTRGEKIALLLIVLLILLGGWYGFIYRPVQERIAAADTTDLESQMELEQMRAAKIKAMQAEIEENKAVGAPVVPSYNNFKQVLHEINRIFGRAYNYNFQFSEPEEDGTTIRRNIAVSATADNYDSAVEMMREILEGPYRSLVHDVTISSESLTNADHDPNIKSGRVAVSFALTYFETEYGAENLNGIQGKQETTNQQGGLANADMSNLERSELETAADAVFGE